MYRYKLLDELKEYLSAKQRYLEQLGLRDEASKIADLGDVSYIKSFWQYDDRVVARLHGFKDAYDYYQRSSSRQFLKSIAVPTLVIQAIDDPFMTPEVLPKLDELNHNVQIEVTEGGGHVGFISGGTLFKPEYWLEQRIPEFIKERFLAWRPSHLTAGE